MADHERVVTVRFEHDVEHGVVVVYPCGHIADALDVDAWMTEMNRRFAEFGGLVDAVVVLDMLTVSAEASAYYQKERSALIRRTTRYCVRVNSSARLLPLAQANTHSAEDIAQAIALIERLRTAKATAAS